MDQEEKITKISIDLLIPNANQPRKIFSEESIKELAISIKEYGILNPILVTKKENLYEIIAGERRYRAAKLIGLKEIPVIIKNGDDAKLRAIALIENLQRENISPIEEAKSYQDIIKISNIKEQELSNLIGKSQPYISNKLRLLKLPQNIQDALINKKISERHARTLISINNPDKQTELLNRVINEKLSVKELETIIKEKDITDEEIKSAIDDIMRTLNIDSKNQEKEEKESDNMNNGNFFPNQQNAIPNSNMTLNAMNMQTLNQNPQVAEQQQSMPTLEVPNQPFVYNQPVPESTPGIPANQIQTPEMSTSPMPNLEIPNPIPNFDIPSTPSTPEAPSMPGIAPTPEIPAAPTMTSSSPIPDFGVPSSPVVPEISPMPNPMPVEPLFDPSAAMTPSPIPTPVPDATLSVPSFEVPVTETQSLPQDKLTEVENYLTNNGINYKKYSNETSHCIIIEL